MPTATPAAKPHTLPLPEARAINVMGDKWSPLLLDALRDGPLRFVRIQEAVPTISTEQLRSRLNRLVHDGLLTRTRYREVPPRVDYALTPLGRKALAVTRALRKFGENLDPHDYELPVAVSRAKLLRERRERIARRT